MRALTDEHLCYDDVGEGGCERRIRPVHPPETLTWPPPGRHLAGGWPPPGHSENQRKPLILCPKRKSWSKSGVKMSCNKKCKIRGPVVVEAIAPQFVLLHDPENGLLAG